MKFFFFFFYLHHRDCMAALGLKPTVKTCEAKQWLDSGILLRRFTQLHTLSTNHIESPWDILPSRQVPCFNVHQFGWCEKILTLSGQHWNRLHKTRWVYMLMYFSTTSRLTPSSCSVLHVRCVMGVFLFFFFLQVLWNGQYPPRGYRGIQTKGCYSQSGRQDRRLQTPKPHHVCLGDPGQAPGREGVRQRQRPQRQLHQQVPHFCA